MSTWWSLICQKTFITLGKYFSLTWWICEFGIFELRDEKYTVCRIITFRVIHNLTSCKKQSNQELVTKLNYFNDQPTYQINFVNVKFQVLWGWPQVEAPLVKENRDKSVVMCTTSSFLATNFCLISSFTPFILTIIFSVMFVHEKAQQTVTYGKKYELPKKEWHILHFKCMLAIIKGSVRELFLALKEHSFLTIVLKKN